MNTEKQNLSPNPRWQKFKNGVLGTAVIVIGAILSYSGSPEPKANLSNTITDSTVTAEQTVTQVKAEVQKINTDIEAQKAATKKITTESARAETGLSNNNHYTNSAGNDVHSPAYSMDDSVPAGASAECRDGTYSFSQSHRGTCSHHGGVARWL